MELGSIGILVAILLTCCASRLIPAPRPRQYLLLAASYLMYAHWAGRRALVILLASTLLNYAWGAVLRRRPTTAILWIAVGCNLLLLGSFKYLLPLAEQWAGVSSEFNLLQQLIVPIGISFWTFQGLSYLFDLYREEELHPNLLEFSLYMAFWPTVLSGPVCRLPKLLPQFREAPATIASEDFSVGTVRIVKGLFMKLLLAQLLASGLIADAGVNAGFDAIAPARSALDVWVLAIGYAFQIYFDFAGYSNMVIGAARLIGIRLQENFDRPYLALTPAIFWTRWHMSLSFWIRDYVFLPLAVARRVSWWPYASIVISMVVFGFWHGARWTYIAWGLYHGLLLLGHRLGQQLKRRFRITLPYSLGIFLSWSSTFLLVCVGYIFFRANDLGQALKMLRALVAPRSYAPAYATLPPEYYLLVVLVALGYFASAGAGQLLALWQSRYRNRVLERLQANASQASIWTFITRADVTLAEQKWWCLTPALGILLMVTGLSVFGESSSIAPFIYTLF
jgi:alginate O-acetyltransferase complex protein AlgI